MEIIYKTLKGAKTLITSVDPVSAVVIGMFCFGIFTVVYILLGGQPEDDKQA